MSDVNQDQLAVDHVTVVEESHDERTYGQELRLIIDSLTDYAILRLDVQGVVRTWSPGAEAIKGYSAGEILGQHFSIFYTPEDRSKGVPLQMLDDARVNGHTHFTGWRIRKDGRRFWGDISITALRSDGGELIGFAKVVRDLSAQHEADEALRRSEERNRLLIGSVVDYAIIGLGPYGVIESWNAGAQRLKRYSQEEIVGQHYAVFFDEDDRASGRPSELLDDAAGNRRAEHTGWRVRKDGTMFWGDLVVTALRDDEGKLIGFVNITRDLSEQHAAEAAAQDAAEQRRLHQLRSDFLQSISHDLRAPVTAIKGFATLLREGVQSDPTQRSQFVRQIEDGADRLSAMVEDLLEMGKIESGSVKLKLEPIPMRKQTEGIVSMLTPLLENRNVVIDVPSDLSVQADRSSLERMLVNLVSNAAKFSPPGGTITIDAGVSEPEVFISVTDEGPGVAEEDKEAIFDRFRQGRRAPLVPVRGSGLGLSMVRDYVTLHDGRVWVEDTEKGGARFVVTLPVGSTGVPAHR